MMSNEEQWVARLTDSTRARQIHWRRRYGGWVADFEGYHVSVREWNRGLFMDYILRVVGEGLECEASGEAVRNLWFVVQQYGPGSGSIVARLWRWLTSGSRRVE